MEKFSADHLQGNLLDILQPEKGYRFSLDPVILCAHVKVTGSERIIDVGCGCGIMPILLANRYSHLKIFGIEIQTDFIPFAMKNVRNHSLERNIHIIHNDIQNIKTADVNGKADMIISNPPYKKKHSGRLNPNSQKAIARHEITLDIDTLFRCSKRLLNKNGKLYMIFPSERLSDLMSGMARHMFCPEFLRFVHIKQNTPAKRVVLCAVKNSRSSCIIPPPLYIYSEDNTFSDEYVSMFKP